MVRVFRRLQSHEMQSRYLSPALHCEIEISSHSSCREPRGGRPTPLPCQTHLIVEFVPYREKALPTLRLLWAVVYQARGRNTSVPFSRFPPSNDQLSKRPSRQFASPAF